MTYLPYLVGSLAGLAVGILLGAILGWKFYLRGYDDGMDFGAKSICDMLMTELEKPQYMTGVNVLYLLKRMREWMK